MSTPSPKTVTQLLLDWRNGDPEAVDKLMPLVYDELHRLAARYMRRERPDHTLEPTALIHEAYLRLVQQNVKWQNRAHFFAIAAQLMRRIVMKHARHRHAAKRGGTARRVSLNKAIHFSEERAADLIALDDALANLASIDPRQSRIVELRFFGGLNVEETAEVLDVSTPTVKREWRIAKAWLRKEIAREE